MKTWQSQGFAWREKGQTMVMPDVVVQFPGEMLLGGQAGVERCSVYVDSEEEALRFKWIESEREGRDLGEEAIRRWVQEHWSGYLRSKWLEHVQGKRFWVELDSDDFGLLLRTFTHHTDLLDRIVDRLKCEQEQLQIIDWAVTFNVPTGPVLEILEKININSKRLKHRFDPYFG
jgi:hypothetical protein